ncbi:hypothetical protein ACFVYR_31250 [Streptomyces sp. NPDC058284]|uniref:hypothetical protein n=1 Tax=unclassified Streptomyces TaxID=2593676 RepID=UPI0036674AD9
MDGLQREGAVAMGVVVIVESVPHVLVGALGRRLLAMFASFRALTGVDAAQVLVVDANPGTRSGLAKSSL